MIKLTLCIEGNSWEYKEVVVNADKITYASEGDRGMNWVHLVNGEALRVTQSLEEIERRIAYYHRPMFISQQAAPIDYDTGL